MSSIESERPAPSPLAERLAEWTPSTGAPLLVVHGRGAIDRYVAADYRVHDLDEGLWSVLRGHGYERVVFSLPHDPIYFLDPTSRAISRQPVGRAVEPAKARRMQNLTGPLGDAVLADAPPAAAAPIERGALSDEAAVTMIGAMLGDRRVRTAVVLPDAEQWLRHTSAVRSLSVSLARILDRPTAGNVLVLVFRHDSLGESIRFVEEMRVYPGLHSHLSRITDSHGASLAVGPPPTAELERLVHVCRLRDGLAVDCWRQLPMVTRLMASSRASVREWEARLATLTGEGVALGADALRERSWISAARSDGRDVWQRLAAMTGLREVKNHLRRKHRRLQAQEALRAQSRGGRADETLHMVFTGNPGTGKTTVAELIGELYRDLGLLSVGHLVVARAPDLVGQYEGQTAPAVHRAVERARGGVLLIDEAYQLSDGDGRFGQEAINALVQDMDALRGELVIIAVGYRDRMATFLAANPGLPSRFPPANIIEFPDYEPAELLEILLGMLREQGLDWTPEMAELLGEVTAGMYRSRSEGFGNARDMRTLAGELADEWADQVGTQVDRPLAPEHLPQRLRSYRVDRELPPVEQLLAELDEMVGLAEVKDAIRGLVRRLALNQRRVAAGLKAAPVVAPHMLFVGPPGTGKTTVARLTGRLLHAIGLLPKGHVVEASKADLVGQWLGQSAPQTRKMLNAARGGVLFVDEAYSLAPDNRLDSFAQEAIDTLTKDMEDAKGRLVVVAAGYEDKMERFLARNPGMRSRFALTVRFPAYSAPELVEILRRRAAADDYVLAPGTAERVRAWFASEKRWFSRKPSEDDEFGNGRTAGNLLDEMSGRLAERALSTTAPDSDVLDTEILRTIRPEDVPDARD